MQCIGQRTKRAKVFACERCAAMIFVPIAKVHKPGFVPPTHCGCPRPAKPKPKPERARAKEFSGTRAAARQQIPLLIERDGLDCQLCGLPIDPTLPRWREDDGLQVDHRHPLSKGGTNALDNLQLTHWRCNQAKGARHTDEEVAA